MIVSHHYLRRRARAKAKKLNENEIDGYIYEVAKATRGPYRYYVRRFKDRSEMFEAEAA